MAVKIRMTRTCRNNRTFWRIGVYSGTTRRDRKALELLCAYDPRQADPIWTVVLNKERPVFWVKNGAQTSPTLRQLLKNAGML